jgi:MFS transporter, DHA2 family, multidrug resistance protein
MTFQSVLALFGIVLAALTAEFNDGVVSAALSDIQGGLYISHDSGTWIESLYITAQVVGMTVSTFWAVTVSLRRFAVFAVVLGALAASLIPFSGNLAWLYALRAAEGLSAGLTIPLLLMIALRVVPLPFRLYGLSAYALTATFGPNAATSLAGIWTDLVDWRFAFWQALPLYCLAGTMLWYGVGQDPPQYARVRKFDWPGALLVVVCAGTLTTVLQQGDRYDWFNSTFICTLSIVGIAALPVLIVNEFIQEIPLFKFSLLRRRNLVYGLIALFTFLLLTLGAGTFPSAYLEQAGFRPEQIKAISLPIALLQFIALPAIAYLLDFPPDDPRVVSLIGVLLMIIGALGNSFITSSWQFDQFVVWQGVSAIGEPMVVLPLLMMATNTIRNPAEGPFASTLVNTTRAVAEPVGVWLFQLIVRWRGALHYNRLADNAGLNRFGALRDGGIVPLGLPGSDTGVTAYRSAVRLQAAVLTLSDGFLVIVALGIFLAAVLLVLPERTLPPRIEFAKR